MNKLKQAINTAKTIVIIQADNPDGDSLASALALEYILSDAGKTVHLQCGVEIPTYLHYMEGWSRVSTEIPTKFDMSIIVDTVAVSLLETAEKSGRLNTIRSKPCFVIDHHLSEATINFAEIITEPAVSTCEVIYYLATELQLSIGHEAAEYICMGILADSLGLTSEAVTARSVQVIADLVKSGVSLAALDNRRKQYQRKSADLVHYKGALMQRITYKPDPRIATVDIPFSEIERYSHAYNPSMLVIDEMRLTEGVQVAIAFKSYPDGKVTAKIRANYGYRIANVLAEHFGGGGHSYAAGFKVTDGRPFTELKAACISKASELLDQIES